MSLVSILIRKPEVWLRHHVCRFEYSCKTTMMAYGLAKCGPRNFLKPSLKQLKFHTLTPLETKKHIHPLCVLDSCPQASRSPDCRAVWRACCVLTTCDSCSRPCSCTPLPMPWLSTSRPAPQAEAAGRMCPRTTNCECCRSELVSVASDYPNPYPFHYCVAACVPLA